MAGIILLSILGIAFLMLIIITYYLHHLEKDDQFDTDANESLWNKLGESKSYVYTGIVLTAVGIIAVIYLLVKGSPWEAHLMEWLNIIVRLMHITFGIAWIGASFYFVFLENALNRTKDLREELAGNLWAVHGGGFYYLEKYKVAPQKIPKDLHWFKYEAYFTWLSGFCLLFIVYYFNAAALLIDKNVLDIAPAKAIGLGIGSFFNNRFDNPHCLCLWLYSSVQCQSGVYSFRGYVRFYNGSECFLCNHSFTKSNGKSSQRKPSFKSRIRKKCFEAFDS